MNPTIIYDKLKKFGALEVLGEAGLKDLVSNITLLKSGRTSKYNNMIVEFGGQRYHSLSEVYYYYILSQHPFVESIEQQVRYRLENMDGKKTLSYIADFVVVDKAGNEYVIDVKGRLTNENKVKLGYFAFVHKKRVTLVETSGPNKFNTSFLSDLTSG